MGLVKWWPEAEKGGKDQMVNVGAGLFDGPRAPGLLVFTPLYKLLPKWLIGPIKYGSCYSLWLLRLDHKPCHLHPGLLDLSLWGKPVTKTWGSSSSPVERSRWRKTGVSCQQRVPICQSYKKATLKGDSPTSVKILNDSCPGQSLGH